MTFVKANIFLENREEIIAKSTDNLITVLKSETKRFLFTHFFKVTFFRTLTRALKVNIFPFPDHPSLAKVTFEKIRHPNAKSNLAEMDHLITAHCSKIIKTHVPIPVWNNPGSVRPRSRAARYLCLCLSGVHFFNTPAAGSAPRPSEIGFPLYLWLDFLRERGARVDVVFLRSDAECGEKQKKKFVINQLNPRGLVLKVNSTNV